MPDIADLKAQRASLAGRLSDVMAARERLRLVQDVEAKILDEIGALGRSEIEALRLWAHKGEGDKPTPDIAARAALHERLVEAQAAAENARGASIDLEAERVEIASELHRFDIAIETHAFDQLATKRREELQLFNEFVAEHVRPKLARLMSLHAFFIERAKECQAAGRDDAARSLLQRAEALANEQPVFEFGPTQGDVIGKISTWSARFAALTSLEPAKPVVVDIDAHRREVEAA